MSKVIIREVQPDTLSPEAEAKIIYIEIPMDSDTPDYSQPLPEGGGVK